MSEIDRHIVNELPELPRYFAGIIGDRPSQYAKSPSIWNPTFTALDIPAAYVSFDVDEPDLGGLVGALRDADSFLGGSVTVPYKQAIIPLLDGMDTLAGQIGAVNTFVREPDGRLIGYNTDGQGALDSLLKPLDGDPAFADLGGRRVLLVGAGGAARAVAFFVARELGEGKLLISNRTAATAEALAASVNEAYGNASAIAESETGEVASEVDLVINASTRGQSGLRAARELATCLEPYSSLAPASPDPVEAGEDADFYSRWYAANASDIVKNHAASLEAVARFGPSTVFFDIVYSPLETVMLSHARWSGHRTLNGKWMNIAQAVDAFVHKVCPAHLDAAGPAEDAYHRVMSTMAEVW